MGKSIGFCCCSGSNESFWQWEEDASFKPCFSVKDKNSMAFQGRQVSFESLTPLNFRAAPQHPVQYLPLASATPSATIAQSFHCSAEGWNTDTGHWTWCCCLLWAWMKCGGTDLRIFGLSYLQVEDTFSSFAVLRLSQLFQVRDETLFLRANGKQ